MGYYSESCDNIIPNHNCDPCAATEYARVRSLAFIKASVYDAIAADPSDPAPWLAAIAAEDNSVIIIPFVNGELQEPAEVLGPGYGDQVEKLLGFDYQLLANDPNYKENCDFYNAIKRSRDYHVAYRTKTQIHISNEPVTIIPKAPIANDLNAEVVWALTIKWRGSDQPCPYDTPEGVFDECFIQGE